MSKDKAVAAADPGVSATQQGDNRYAVLLADLCEKVSDTVRRNLQFYWDLGEKAHELVSKPGNYGNKTVENLAADIVKNTGVFSFGKQSVYKAITFYKNISKDHLQQLQDKNVSWRNAAMLADGRMKPEQRESMVSEIVSGKLQQDKVSEAIKTKLDLPARTAAKKMPKPLSKLKGMPELFNMVMGKVTGYGQCARDIFRDSDLEAMKKARELIIEVRDAFDALSMKWAKEMKQADDELAKVEEQIAPKKKK